MSATILEHPGPWSEDEYFALGETMNRVELVDGSLWVSPSPTNRHQHISFLLARELYGPAQLADLLVLQDVNLRLASARVLEPDIVVANASDLAPAVDAADTVLVVEIVSPSNAGMDRLLKPQLYAAAGIGWYLRVEQPQESVELHLQRLVEGQYVSFAVAGPGEELVTEEPFPFRLEIASLLGHRRRR
ncbi:Uma2 family endonuclease [Actinoplanes sp. L3-i22]|uniref:Uma2 family endonuclease n=1 Tax=Actinoplanes sp. L3-i22 TaxID=2836373 RepID=UPI001C757CBB|nr:Uma2 family endonuclease [Actinoplanes sp. L3-i22]BCY08179.1 hypothetical protein L3i22_032670 [Actinoplanes sp. L3-i22]